MEGRPKIRPSLQYMSPFSGSIVLDGGGGSCGFTRGGRLAQADRLRASKIDDEALIQRRAHGIVTCVDLQGLLAQARFGDLGALRLLQ